MRPYCAVQETRSSRKRRAARFRHSRSTMAISRGRIRKDERERGKM